MAFQSRTMQFINCACISEMIQRCDNVFVAPMPVRIRQPNQDIQKFGSETEPRAEMQPTFDIDSVVFAVCIFKHAQRESAAAFPCNADLPQKLILRYPMDKQVPGDTGAVCSCTVPP